MSSTHGVEQSGTPDIAPSSIPKEVSYSGHRWKKIVASTIGMRMANFLFSGAGKVSASVSENRGSEQNPFDQFMRSSLFAPGLLVQLEEKGVLGSLLEERIQKCQVEAISSGFYSRSLEELQQSKKEIQKIEQALWYAKSRGLSIQESLGKTLSSLHSALDFAIAMENKRFGWLQELETPSREEYSRICGAIRQEEEQIRIFLEQKETDPHLLASRKERLLMLQKCKNEVFFRLYHHMQTLDEYIDLVSEGSLDRKSVTLAQLQQMLSHLERLAQLSASYEKELVSLERRPNVEFLGFKSHVEQWSSEVRALLESKKQESIDELASTRSFEFPLSESSSTSSAAPSEILSLFPRRKREVDKR